MSKNLKQTTRRFPITTFERINIYAAEAWKNCGYYSPQCLMQLQHRKPVCNVANTFAALQSIIQILANSDDFRQYIWISALAFMLSLFFCNNNVLRMHINFQLSRT